MATSTSDPDPSTSNKALLINCLGSEGTPIFAQIMKEFTGELDCCEKQSFLWVVNNKYYSAKILLQYGCCNGEVEAKVDDYEAVVIIYDCTKSAHLVSALANTWHKVTHHLSGDKDFEAPICLLLAVVDQQCTDDHLEQVLRWCVDNNMELIEWRSEGSEKVLGESEDREIRGTARLVEALQAHVWPDIAMKSSGGTETTQTLTKDLLSEDERLLSKGFDRGKDPEGESFEELFAKFADMKAHAQELPSEQRKAYAEKVVLAFWDAIGGDEEEVKDLDDL